MMSVVSVDGLLLVIKLPLIDNDRFSTSSLQKVFEEVHEDTPLTGVRFLDAGSVSIVVSGYDSNELLVYTDV